MNCAPARMSGSGSAEIGADREQHLRRPLHSARRLAWGPGWTIRVIVTARASSSARNRPSAYMIFMQPATDWPCLARHANSTTSRPGGRSSVMVSAQRRRGVRRTDSSQARSRPWGCSSCRSCTRSAIACACCCSSSDAPRGAHHGRDASRVIARASSPPGQAIVDCRPLVFMVLGDRDLDAHGSCLQTWIEERLIQRRLRSLGIGRARIATCSIAWPAARRQSGGACERRDARACLGPSRAIVDRRHLAPGRDGTGGGQTGRAQVGACLRLGVALELSSPPIHLSARREALRLEAAEDRQRFDAVEALVSDRVGNRLHRVRRKAAVARRTRRGGDDRRPSLPRRTAGDG